MRYSTAIHRQKISALQNANAPPEEISSEYDRAIEKCNWGTPAISSLLFLRAIHRVEKLEDYAGVVRDLQLASIKASNKANVIGYLGFVYCKMQKWDLAEKYYHEALALDPSPVRQKRQEAFLKAKEARQARLVSSTLSIARV